MASSPALPKAIAVGPLSAQCGRRRARRTEFRPSTQPKTRAALSSCNYGSGWEPKLRASVRRVTRRRASTANVTPARLSPRHISAPAPAWPDRRRPEPGRRRRGLDGMTIDAAKDHLRARHAMIPWQDAPSVFARIRAVDTMGLVRSCSQSGRARASPSDGRPSSPRRGRREVNRFARDARQLRNGALGQRPRPVQEGL
jgi:hypothetical protein